MGGFNTPGNAAESLERDRFKLSPSLSVSEAYTDNVFLNPDNKKSDFITTISPDIRLDIALAPKNILCLGYEGEFLLYSEYDNFKTDLHKPYVQWAWTQPKGTKIKAAASTYFGSFQPYSPDQESRDYTLTEAFLDTLFKLGAFSDVGLTYKHTKRRFDKDEYELDDFDSHSMTTAFVYNGFNFVSPLFEYNVYIQDNNDLTGPSSDFMTHTILLGIKWSPDRRLAGSLKGGYFLTDFKKIPDYSSYTIDADLTYRFSDFTQFKLVSFRHVFKSTWAERETGTYYISTGAGLSIIYRRFAPLEITADFDYIDNDFKQVSVIDPDRRDNLSIFRLAGRYFFHDWLSLSLGYQYRQNDSNYWTVNYTENQIILSIKAQF